MTTSIRVHVLAGLALGLAALIAGGCGGPSRAQVRGIVTLDGKRVPDGSIEFFPINGVGQSAGTAIKDGVYQLEASVGEMKVVINASEVVGQQKAYDTPDSPLIDIVRSAIPARYNTHSTLKATLVVGANDVNFELESDKKK